MNHITWRNRGGASSSNILDLGLDKEMNYPDAKQLLAWLNMFDLLVWFHLLKYVDNL